MAYSLQLLRALMVAHPDQAGDLQPHVFALEEAIETEPARCVERVRALFEAAHITLGLKLGLDFSAPEEFPKRNSRVIKTLDFSIDGHPEAKKINIAIQKLLGGINGTIGALAELSNIPGMRHGGAFGWATLERQHAVMLGGLCDTLVSFLVDIAWKRPALLEGKRPSYDDFADFNVYLDDENDEVEIAGSKFLPSRILYTLDELQYEAVRLEWTADQPPAQAGEETAA